jgi:hypothetical protein
MNLSKHIKYSLGLVYANGSAVRNGAIIDMSGWDGVLIIVSNAAIAVGAVGDVHAESGAQSNMSDAADLTGTAIATAADDDNEVKCIDLYRPRERYVRGVITKDTSNNQAESMMYIQYRGRKLPVSDSGFDEYELHISPAEGTK